VQCRSALGSPAVLSVAMSSRRWLARAAASVLRRSAPASGGAGRALPLAVAEASRASRVLRHGCPTTAAPVLVTTPSQRVPVRRFA
jgi:hypothetical protein